MSTSSEFYTCIICEGDGYITDTSDPGKTRKEICPCRAAAYAQGIMDDMVSTGYDQECEAKQEKRNGS
jgi:hypothetical protein